jgi:hypothetical protein
MDERPEIDHGQFSRAKRCGTVTFACRERWIEERDFCLLAPGPGLPQLAATETLTIGRSPERAHVLVSTVA